MRCAITVGPADQRRPGQVLVDHDLHRAQHALLLALGEGDALVLGASWPALKIGRIVVPEA